MRTMPSGDTDRNQRPSVLSCVTSSDGRRVGSCQRTATRYGICSYRHVSGATRSETSVRMSPLWSAPTVQPPWLRNSRCPPGRSIRAPFGSSDHGPRNAAPVPSVTTAWPVRWSSHSDPNRTPPGAANSPVRSSTILGVEPANRM
ncbi:hypothetical protein GCM10025787_02550 [Saccharopolyspora rosea]